MNDKLTVAQSVSLPVFHGHIVLAPAVLSLWTSAKSLTQQEKSHLIFCYKKLGFTVIIPF